MSDQDESDPTGDEPTEDVDASELLADPSAYKILGELEDASGVGVLGRNTASSGTTHGVRGEVGSPDGYGLSTPDDARVDGAIESSGDLLARVDGTRVGRVGGKDGSYGGAVVFGHEANAGGGVPAATVSGGGCDGQTNDVYDRGGTVGGGIENRAGVDDPNDTAIYATVGGGNNNEAAGDKATVSGGSANSATGDRSTVGGGTSNGASDQFATVSGGRYNFATGYGASCSGGESNSASKSYATVAGGNSNAADEFGATVGGGDNNTASGSGGTVPGGANNVASGKNSLAAGSNAEAADDNAFVWADGTTDSSLAPVTFSSSSGMGPTGSDSFSVRATGGVRFGSDTNSDGAVNAGVKLEPGSGAFDMLSTETMKTNVRPVDTADALERVESLEISRWEYDTVDDADHVGPMAEQFHEAFGLGGDERSISTVDADGVAFAAIQGLSEKLAEKDERIDELEERVAALEGEERQSETASTSDD